MLETEKKKFEQGNITILQTFYECIYSTAQAKGCKGRGIELCSPV